MLARASGSRSWADCRRVLHPKATLVLVGAPKGNRVLGPLSHIGAIRLGSLRASQKVVFFVSKRRNADLVTLSACETGLSTVAPGDELIGLARGFFAAGAPSLLISLWTVDDDATASLMVTFYEHLQRTRSCATALRAAQLQLLQEKPHPFFWAPFVLMGRP